MTTTYLAMKKTVLITGAAGGIGVAISKHLAANGWIVGMIDINTELPTIASEIEGETATAICDVRESEQVEAAIEKIESTLGSIDGGLRLNNNSIT